MFPVAYRQATSKEARVEPLLDRHRVVVRLPHAREFIWRGVRGNVTRVGNRYKMSPVILVIDAKASLDINNRLCAVGETAPEMPDNHFENVVLGLDFGDIHAIGCFVETHHSIHVVHFATHRSRDCNERNHFET